MRSSATLTTLAAAALLLASLACNTLIPAPAPIEPTLEPLSAAYLTITALPPPTSSPTTTPLPSATPSPTDTQPPPTRTATGTPTSTPTLVPTPSRTQAYIFLKPSDCVPRDTQQEEGIATHILDGDVIVVEIDGVPRQVRYIGLQAPKTSGSEQETFGKEAALKNAELVLNKPVLLIRDIRDMDQFNRLLRYVFVGELFVNHALVRGGYAGAFPNPPDVTCNPVLEKAEREAQAEKAGMWAFVPIPTTTTIIVVVPRATSPVKETLAPCACTKDTYNCGDFYTQSEAQACYTRCLIIKGKDVHGLDDDGNGKACEWLPW